MRYAVSKVRHNGQRTSKPSPAVVGELVLLQWFGETNRTPRLRAELTDAAGRGMLPVLDYASVIRVTRTGMAITGREMLTRGLKGPIERVRQTWWCQIVAQD